MAQATAWLRYSLFLSPSASHSLYLARRRYPFPSSLLLKRKAKPQISASSPPSTSNVASTDAVASTVFHIHNTLTKRKEPFRPKVEGKVGMYVCGITAYDLSHIGHARVSVVFDVLYRWGLDDIIRVYL